MKRLRYSVWLHGVKAKLPKRIWRSRIFMRPMNVTTTQSGFWKTILMNCRWILTKTSGRFYLARAASLLERDEWERAETDLKRAVEIAPEQPAALNYLGYSWAERGVNLEEAFELIEKAVSLQPNSGAIIDSLGWARYQLGDYEEAVGHLAARCFN